MDYLDNRKKKLSEEEVKKKKEAKAMIAKNLPKAKVIDLLGNNYENEIGGRLAKLNLNDNDSQRIKSAVISSYNSGASDLKILQVYLEAVNPRKKEDTKTLIKKERPKLSKEERWAKIAKAEGAELRNLLKGKY